jgi:membrane-bound lytic murein transglycosylase A
MRTSGLLLLAMLAGLGACAPRVADVPSLPGPPPQTEPRIEPAPPVPGAGPQSLPRWGQENHLDALMAYARSCGLVREPAYVRVCDEARALSRSADTSPSVARAFFEQRFTLEPVDGQGLLTGYFAPEYLASPVRTDTFDMPLLAAPAARSPLPERSVIEAEALQGRSPWQPLAWLRAEDLFFLQIQGSGYLTLPDGRRLRAGYAADNGHPFSGIARVMVQQGILADHQTSADNIRRWLSDNRGERARAIMATNAPLHLLLSGGGRRGPPGRCRRCAPAPPARHRRRSGPMALWRADVGRGRWRDTGRGHEQLSRPCHCSGYRQCHPGKGAGRPLSGTWR